MFNELKQKFAASAVCAFVCMLFMSMAASASSLDKIEWKTEKHYGNQSVAEFENYPGYIDDPLLTGYVNRVGNDLVSVCDRRDIPYEFFIVDSDEINAFAAPGGFVFVTRGLVESADTEDELAAVMAHEIGHVTSKHGLKNIKKGILYTIGATILSQSNSDSTMMLAGYAYSLMQLHYSREYEYQADTLSARYSYDSGYDPGAMVSFFDKLEQAYPTGNLSRIQVSFQTHPKTPNRVANILRTPQMAQETENFMHIASSYRERFCLYEAVDYYKKALELEPENIDAALGIAESLNDVGDANQAVEWFEYALDIDPNNSDATQGYEIASAKLNSDDTVSITRPDSDVIGEYAATLASTAVELEDVHATALETRPQVQAYSGNIEKSLLKNYNSYASIAKTVNSYYDARKDAIARAGANLDGVLMTMNNLESVSWALPQTIDDAAKKARTMEFKIANSKRVSNETVAAAADYSNEINYMAQYEETLMEDLVDLAAQTEQGFIYTHNAIAAVGRSLDDDAISVSLMLTELDTSLDSTAEGIQYIYNRSVEAADELNMRRIRLRRALVNFNASMLSPDQENVFRKRLQARFGLDPDDIEQLRAAGAGYADVLLALSFARGSGTGAEKIISDALRMENDTIDYKSYLLSNIRDPGGSLLLLELAEKDLMLVTRWRSLVDLEPEADPAAVDVVAAGAGADDLLVKAAEALDDGDPDAAISILDERGRSNSATALSHMVLGMAYRNSGLYGEALEEFKHSLKKEGRIAYSHLLTAITFSDVERYEDAENEFLNALEMEPDDPDFIVAHAYSLAKQGQTGKAMEKYEEVVYDYGYENEGTLLNLGLLYYEEGYIVDAIEMFRTVLEEDPEREHLAEMVRVLENP